MPRCRFLRIASLVCLALAGALQAGPAAGSTWDESVEAFASHYAERLGEVAPARQPIDGGSEVAITSPKLRGPGNEPVLLLHEGPRHDAIVLVHGLSDSPFYMRAIADRFFAAGANVVLPLLPAHGLVDPDAAFEDEELVDKWKGCVLHAVDVATMLGDRVSIGGLSTGGALSVYTALEEPEAVNGGLFLFSAALDVGGMNAFLGSWPIITPGIAKMQDGRLRGLGPNPFKYPKLSRYGGLKLTRLISEINDILGERGPTQEIFAVHSIHDGTAFPKGLGNLLKAPGAVGVSIVVANNPPIEHANMVLEHDIAPDPELIEDRDDPPPTPRANPAFEGMMDLALTFFRALPPPGEKAALGDGRK